ncbi:IclR family transcriptional regulator [Chelatococcus daeguensis]|uniref:Transcriptional regulator n=1 Tax=Chelatococcus daeguensis TaxID=444444 RepID=A0AAC9JPH0_9HYPH|nr:MULTISPECIES: IclR family transcriptional regulator [Chelatococcus]APF36505.1 transcriptional regulator [Chelatococcus daeguensis]KZE33733.1 transcriptional regulator [Chelatococcus daeguensis]MBM3082808.1 IclR family transcriptional regulator [Chelatococcus daeguensis]
MTRTQRKDLVNSLGKMASILQCFTKHDRTLTLGMIQARTGYPKATAHRLLATMKEIGFIEQDRDRERYRLGLKLFELGSLYLANLDLHREAQPHVDRLAKLSGEVVHLCIFDGLHAVFVDRKEMDSGPSSLVMTIEGAPVYCTGVGKAILAFQDEATLERVIAAGLKAFTENTIVDPQRLREEMAATRKRGHSIDWSEHQRNLNCVAAPIRNASGSVFASISVSGPAERISPARIPVLGELVIETADTISRALGWTAPAKQAESRSPPRAAAS